MTDSLVSVIVPVYQAESYLNRCLKSIVEQSYNKLQIIVVDDGSTDNTPRICDDWASRDKRIEVIHQPNGGVGAARNTGLDAVRGDYIAWVDSDDWIDECYIERLFTKLGQYHADMVVSQEWATSDVVLAGRDILKHQIMADLGVLWSSLTKSRLFADKRFGDYAVCEDGMILMQVCADCTKLLVSAVDGYHYTERENSASRSFDLNTVMSRFDAMDDRNEYVRLHYSDFYKYVHYTSVLDASKIYRAIKIMHDKNKDIIKKRVKNTILAHVFKVPFWMLTRQQLREWLSGIKILLTLWRV